MTNGTGKHDGNKKPAKKKPTKKAARKTPPKPIGEPPRGRKAARR